MQRGWSWSAVALTIAVIGPSSACATIAALWAPVASSSTILEAQEVLLLATGAHKAAIVAQALEGPITAMVSATALPLHPRGRGVVDEAAASGLKGRAYYDFVFQTEPDWDECR